MARLALHCENFRRFRDLQLDLSAPVTVLIGPNGSGKSNILDALLTLRDGLLGAPQNAFQARGGLLRILTRHQDGLAMRVTLFADAVDSGILRAVVGAAGDSLRGLSYLASCDHDPDGIATAPTQGVWENIPGTSYPNYQEIRNLVSRTVHVDAFRNVSDYAQLSSVAQMAESGADLAAILHLHHSNDRERFFQFETLMRRVLPQIDIIQSPLHVGGGGSSTVSVRFKDDEQVYELAHLSSGIKDAMVLLTAVHFSATGSLVLLEEPENHLDGGAQRAIMEIIAEVAERDDKQFLITTHSEVLVGMTQTEAIYFVAPADEPGTSVVRPVAELDDGLLEASLGVDVGKLLTSLGMQPQVLLVVEGRTDLEATEPIWESFGIKDRVMGLNANGGSADDIATAAASLREVMKRFRLPAKVFVLLDSDGDAAGKRAVLAAHGFDARNSHVWDREEIEDYLLIADSLGALTSQGRSVVDGAIDRHQNFKREGFRPSSLFGTP
jgi:predicted ATPase